MSGFLGTGASFAADLNLTLQLSMAAALGAGMALARRKHYRAHAVCQSAVVLLNLVLIARIMLPSFRDGVLPGLPAGLSKSYYSIATLHAAAGGVAQLLGIYIVLAAGTKLLPERLRFRNYKRWMRTELALWWIVVVLGAATYYVWL
ncbi:MAG TPA: DUF420 domain-containing protein [Candidatus Binatia bacterium]|nr:DUF420 domain-containing protein [Candidatus Binatia bacterium]